MMLLPFSPWLLAALALQDPAPQAAAQQLQAAAPPRVLFLTHSAGFTHSVVKRPAQDQLAFAERALVTAAAGRLEVTPTQDCTRINAEELSRFDAVLFYTTGELPISEEGRAALMDWIRAGGAFAGSHCATDTLYQYAPYVELVGGLFDGHPWHQDVSVLVEEAGHPAVDHLGEAFRIKDEIYQFHSFRRHPLRVLLSLDPTSVEIGRGKRADGDYALAWCKDHGQGRMFYTALGHREEVWQDERFLDHLMSGIEWAVAGPDDSSPAPANARILLGSESLDGWRQQSGKDPAWSMENGVAQVQPGTGNLATEAFLGSGLYHVEFQVPPSPEDAAWQNRGNSGVYVQGRYEVQVLDSLGDEPQVGGCGGIYGHHAPRLDACRPAGRWQSYDIRFTAPTFDERGKKQSNARMSVWHNGIAIHRDAEVPAPTTAALQSGERDVGPLMLQDHGHPVRYRNIWFVPAEDPQSTGR